MARFIHVRLDETADQDIIEWLSAQANRTETVKAACRLSMTSTGYQVGSPSAVTVGGNCEARSAFAELDLSDGSLAAIRAVMDAALDEKLPEHLAGVTLGIEQSLAVTARGGAGDADSELAAKLDAMF